MGENNARGYSLLILLKILKVLKARKALKATYFLIANKVKINLKRGDIFFEHSWPLSDIVPRVDLSVE